ncbi:MAG: hypothetical protein A4E72_01163 [Syntrophus sp. PtaU1.Bin208]|nr:MAG: hypothetical protein A4E72_01163 [Syntrophus sp. PtaU1.Bin208]
MNLIYALWFFIGALSMYVLIGILVVVKRANHIKPKGDLT